jgi:hypothetical protein
MGDYDDRLTPDIQFLEKPHHLLTGPEVEIPDRFISQ